MFPSVVASHHRIVIAQRKRVVGNEPRALDNARSRASSPGESPAGDDCQTKLVSVPEVRRLPRRDLQ
jgi:hypothetical protein